MSDFDCRALLSWIVLISYMSNIEKWSHAEFAVYTILHWRTDTSMSIICDKHEKKPDEDQILYSDETKIN